MATNQHLREAQHISLPVPSGTVTGDPVVVGSIVGVAITNRGEGGNESTHATVWCDGSWHLTVSDAVSAVGTPVYFVTGSKELTNSASGNTLFGYALATKGAAAGTIPVRIAQV